jgi:hypothetical protein
MKNEKWERVREKENKKIYMGEGKGDRGRAGLKK